jgi:large subunit ribosomal protein L28
LVLATQKLGGITGRDTTLAILDRRMSKVCAICGKGPSFGHNRSHSMVATKRRFNPNLQRVRILVNGVARRSYVCARCLKSGRVEKAI